MLQDHVVVDKNHQAKNDVGPPHPVGQKIGTGRLAVVGLRIGASHTHGNLSLRLLSQATSHTQEPVPKTNGVNELQRAIIETAGPVIDRGHLVTRNKHSGNIECRVHGSVGRRAVAEQCASRAAVAVCYR